MKLKKILKKLLLINLLIVQSSCPTSGGCAIITDTINSVTLSSFSNENKKISFIYSKSLNNTSLDSNLYLIDKNGQNLKLITSLENVEFNNTNFDNIPSFYSKLFWINNYIYALSTSNLTAISQDGKKEIIFKEQNLNLSGISSDSNYLILSSFKTSGNIDKNFLFDLKAKKSFEISSDEIKDPFTIFLIKNSNKVYFISEHQVDMFQYPTFSYKIADIDYSNGKLTNIQLIKEVTPIDGNDRERYIISMIFHDNKIIYKQSSGEYFSFDLSTKKESKYDNRLATELFIDEKNNQTNIENQNFMKFLTLTENGIKSNILNISDSLPKGELMHLNYCVY